MSAANAINAAKHLVRQQTFPPLQPYIRARYMSATGDISSTYPETLVESHSSSSDSQADDNRGVLGISKKDSFKREKELHPIDKGCKVAKLSIVPGQKENLDPSFTKKNLNRRRGSAPIVTLPSKSTQDDAASNTFKAFDRFMRRGSMPMDTTFTSLQTSEYLGHVRCTGTVRVPCAARCIQP